MHKFIYANKDAWISELSSSVNYGYDQVLELRKDFTDTATESNVNGVTIILVQFDLTDVSNLIDSGKITSPEYYLRLYSTEASELQSQYNVHAYVVSDSWEEGTGNYFDNPTTGDGTTWSHRDKRNEILSWSLGTVGSTFNSYSASFGGTDDIFAGSGNTSTGSQREGIGGGTYYDEDLVASQSFSYQSPDIEMNVTDVVNSWISGSYSNYGFMIKRPDSEEDDINRSDLKFFSRNTHTIYPPKLEIRWDDHNFVTSSMNELSMSGNVDNYVYVKGIRPQYRETETVRFRVGARPRYVKKSFSTSIQTVSSSFISEGSGSYSIVDLATNETIIPFSDYTELSCGGGDMYFNQDLNTFQPNRMYKILLKSKYDDGQEVVYDDDEFQFKVVK